jgi:hypothetical protein
MLPRCTEPARLHRSCVEDPVTKETHAKAPEMPLLPLLSEDSGLRRPVLTAAWSASSSLLLFLKPRQESKRTRSVLTPGSSSSPPSSAGGAGCL